MIKFLVDHKADVNVRDIDGNTPLHLASFFLQHHAVELLGKSGGDIDAKNRYLETPNILTEDPMMLRILKARNSRETIKEWAIAIAPGE